MKTSREPRSRPAIKPILTKHTQFDLTGPPHRALASLDRTICSPSPISPRTQIPPLYPTFYDNGMKLHDKAVVDSLDKKRLSPAKKEWHLPAPVPRPAGDFSVPSPLTAGVRPRPPFSASFADPHPDRRHTVTLETSGLNPSKNQNTLPSPVRPMGRRQSAPSGDTDFRLVQFQRSREDLWRQGLRLWGNPIQSDVLVVPIELGRQFGLPSSNGTALLSQSSAFRVSAVIASSDRPPVSLTRTFDLDALRATIPEPLPPTPSSAHFKGLPSPVIMAARNGMPLPLTSDTTNARRSLRSRRGSGSVQSPRSAGLGRTKFRPVPIHFPYARAYLPVLAAIIMSDPVKRGDTIRIPLPHPRAWHETVGFVYTGLEELLTSAVKENILYLGGKV